MTVNMSSWWPTCVAPQPIPRDVAPLNRVELCEGPVRGIHTDASKRVTMVSGMSTPGQIKSTVAKAASFELQFTPSAELITVVRKFLENFYLKVMGDADTSSRVALTTHELLENAAKYSVDGDVRLSVQVDGQLGTAVVRATNRSTPAQIERLRACFEEIASAADVSLYYAEMVRRSAHRTSGWGGLGLARIWAESDMSIRLVVTGDEVEIYADGPIHAKR